MINMSTMRSFVLIALFLPVLSFAQDSTDVCRNLTPESRRIAEASGLNVDALCSGQDAIIIPSQSMAEPVVVTRREPEAVATTVAPPAAPTDLQPFGYDLFAGSPTTFVPVTGIPVSRNYLLGPGDTLQILFYGATNKSYRLEINRDGIIDVPEMGPVSLTGLTFTEAKEILFKRISEQFIGVEASISLGELRSIQIFILGEAYKPGAYTVSSLSTITNALVVSGGVSNIASLRNIQLKRAGKVVATLDLYDLLLHGDISNDLRLQAADVIYIPTVGDLVSVNGEVLRPAIYELKGNTTAQQLVDLAGGLGSKAFPSSAHIERISDSGFMTVIDLDLTEVEDQNLPLIRGDYLLVSSIVERKENIVTVSGHVYRPGQFSWKEGMRISDLLSDIDQFPDKIDLDFSLLQRELPPIGEVQALAVDLRSVLANPGSEADLKLSPRDVLMIFSTESPRNMGTLLDVLRTQARFGELARVVSISGSARFSGTYPLTPGMTVTQLIQAAGGLVVDKVDLEYALLQRELPPTGEVQALAVDLRSVLANPGSEADLKLSPSDQLFIFSTEAPRGMGNLLTSLRRQARFGELARVVSISGNTKFSGEYPLTPGMTVTQLIQAAGGLTEEAYAQSVEVSRLDLSNPELAEYQHQSFGLAAAFNDLSTDILLLPYDSVTVRTVPEFMAARSIDLRGEFRFPGAYKYTRGETLSQVIKRAGGLTDLAHTKAAIFTRVELREREDQRLGQLREQLSLDIAKTSLRRSTAAGMTELAFAQDRLTERLERAVSIGRLVIDLQGILDGTGEDINLKDGDSLYIPQFNQEVSVIGEVQHPTSHLYYNNLRVKDYLTRSGGITSNADKNRIYIVKADGSVSVPSSSSFFVNRKAMIQPGDTLVVPFDVSQMQPLTAWSEITQVIYQLAIATAAVNSF